MSRRNISKKRLPPIDFKYNSFLVNLLIHRILKCGKKTIAQNLVYSAFDLIQMKTKKDPLIIFEKSIKKARPLVEVKSKRVGGSTYQVPLKITTFRSTILALRWIIYHAKKRVGKNMAIKLANEIIDTANARGNTIKKKEETHKMAEANKAFAHYRY